MAERNAFLPTLLRVLDIFIAQGAPIDQRGSTQVSPHVAMHRSWPMAWLQIFGPDLQNGDCLTSSTG